MVKTYLKYYLKDVLGLITGKLCKPITSFDGKLLFTGSNEYIIVIDLKTGQIIKKLKSEVSQVTCLCLDPTGNHLAVGYQNGTIIVFDVLNDYSPAKKFSLHKSAITSLQFNKSMNLLASGSKDTNIYVWDIIGETVLYRLTGHKDSITKIGFYNIKFENYDEIESLISCSKDNTVKLWNIKNQEVLQTIADLVHKVTDFIIVDNILVMGSYDNKLRLYVFQKKYINELNVTSYMSLKGSLTRQSSYKILSISTTPDEKMFSILSNDNSIEFFKILTQTELKRRLVHAEMSKIKKTEKREKLIMKEKFTEINDKVKGLIAGGEYNLKFHFYSMFNFVSENENKILSLFFIKQKAKSNIWNYGIALNNNSIEIYDLSTKLLNQNVFNKNSFTIEETKPNAENLSVDKSFAIDIFGHRDIIRFIKFSERDKLFLSASNDSIKLWNYASLNLIKTNALDNIISGTFILNDKYVNTKLIFRSFLVRNGVISFYLILTHLTSSRPFKRHMRVKFGIFILLNIPTLILDIKYLLVPLIRLLNTGI
jgi:U3 small nucleolar RNA-associated protein 12